MNTPLHWHKEPGARVEASRRLDSSKLQAPCIARNPSGGFRLFYTAVGPGKPFPDCQGYILSAVSDDGLDFRTEPGIRLSPEPGVPQRSLRLIAPSITPCAEGTWRAYFESRGPANLPTVIGSAISTDQLQWDFEQGIRLQSSVSLGGPRYLRLPDGHGRLYCFGSDKSDDEPKSVISAVTSDGLNFEFEPGYRLQSNQSAYDALGITAAEVLAPESAGEPWIMVYSSWQDIPAGTAAPVHPGQDENAVASGRSENFAAESIAVDMAGYRSRIFVATSTDGLEWERGPCLIEGAGYGEEGLDAVHAEDMSLIQLDDGRYRMYYAACDKDGNWRIASAVTE